MTEAEELNLKLELIFDNSPTFWHSRIGTDPEKKDLIFRLESGAFLMHFMLFSRFFILGMYGCAIFSSQLLDQPIEQPMTTNASEHSPTEYYVRCRVIISSKRYASTHLRCMLDVPENCCVPLLTVTPPPPIFYWSRRRRKKIYRRAAAEILTSVQGSMLVTPRRPWAVQKRLNRSKCRMGFVLWWAQ